MRSFNFDEIDDIALAVVRTDMARIYGEVVQEPKQVEPQVDETGTFKLPMFLRRQAS